MIPGRVRGRGDSTESQRPRARGKSLTHSGYRGRCESLKFSAGHCGQAVRPLLQCPCPCCGPGAPGSEPHLTFSLALLIFLNGVQYET
jgi:hypothetical protein